MTGATARRAGRGRRRASVAAVPLAALLAGGTLAACSSSGGSASVTAEKSFYNGKTIQLIVPGAPGKGSAFLATALQQAMEAKLGATINIEYVTGADTVGQDQVYSAKPDGLTIGLLTIISDINNTFGKNEALSFSLEKAAATSIGASYAEPGVVATCGAWNVSSFAQAISGNTQLKFVDVTTGGMNLAVHLLMMAYPASHKYLNGYTSSTETVGCERGDGNIAGYPVSNFLDSSGTALDPGLTPLLLTGSLPTSSAAASLNNSVETIAAYAKAHPPTTAEGQQAVQLLETYYNTDAPQFALFGPNGIPAARLSALTSAMKSAMAEPSVQQKLASAGIPSGYVAPAGIKTYVDTMFKSEAVAEKALGS
jgi:tripartite-type tricarboxylate transporter receptor subunit TctC